LLLLCLAQQAYAEVLRIGVDNVSVRYSEINTRVQNDDIEPAIISLLNQQLHAQGETSLTLEAVYLSDNIIKNGLLGSNALDAVFMETSFPPVADGEIETLPLFTTHWRIVSLPNRRQNAETNLNDLNDKHIIVVNDAPLSALKQRYPRAMLITTASLGEAIALLKAGAGDGVFCRQAAASVLSENIYPGELQVSDVDSLVTETHLRMRADNPAVLAALNRAIPQLPQDTIKDILSRNFTVLTLMNIVPMLRQTHRNFDTAAVAVGVASLFLISFLIGQVVRRRQAEQRLKDSVKFWEVLLNSLSTPVLVCNAAGIITHVNQALCQSLNIDRRRIIGSMVEGLNKQFFTSPALETAGLVKASQATEPQFFEGHYTLNQNLHSIAGWITPYSNTSMLPQGLVIGWYDMTERIKLEGQLAQALTEAKAFSHEKSEFLARMSHEIRSPMNVIMGVLEIENQRLNNPQSPIAVAYNASRGLLQIVGDILDLSKIEAGEMQLKPTPVSLFTLLTRAAEAYQTLAKRKGLNLNTHIESCFGQYYLIDEGKLRQVVNNLLSNAVKYTQTGHVVLSVRRVSQSSSDKNQELIISITDSGIGIAPALLPGIIKPYRQISSSTPDSTGLGLTICHQLVVLMGGKLEISSRENIGSTFSVRLTLKRVEADQAPSSTADFSAVNKGFRLWVVDDLPANLLVMKMQLSALGHQVTTFNKAAEALAELQRHPAPKVDMILTDCQMPEMSGYAFANRVREWEGDSPSHLPIVGCTANAFSDEETKCLKAGMDAHLTKPMTQADLKNCLQELLQNRRIDLDEVMALSAGQSTIINNIINELKQSSAEDLLLIEQAWQTGDIDTLKGKVHRLKGNFALTQFEAGQNLCLTLERKLSQDGRDIERYLLLLRHTTRHFISLLQAFQPPTWSHRPHAD
jgi:two-component system sensor histidine kinase EvgS